MSFGSLEEICAQCRQQGLSFWEVVLADHVRETGESRQEAWDRHGPQLSGQGGGGPSVRRRLRSASGLAGRQRGRF